MNAERIEQLLAQGEGIALEFKRCRSALNSDAFETICAFLNRNGGELLLGVTDKGEPSGVDQAHIEQICKDFVAACNNPQKLSPPCYLHIERVDMEGRIVLYILVPPSSQVHRCAGRIYDRNEDGDFDITNNQALVAALYLRKQSGFTENNLFPYAELADLRPEIIERARKMAALRQENHPWRGMNDAELLSSTQMIRRDLVTGKRGITLAGILLFGKETTILSALPAFRTDAIMRRINLDRYDDRNDIRINLIESYDRLLAFGEKHLNDPFYLDGDQRVSLRGRILREVVGNLLIHREFTSAFPAKLVIEGDLFFTENSNRASGHGPINPAAFSPHPKNPSLARVFREIGLADELGSGTRNLFRFCRSYCGHDPRLIENDVFRFELRLGPELSSRPESESRPESGPKSGPKSRPKSGPKSGAGLEFKLESTMAAQIIRALERQELSLNDIGNQIGREKESGGLKRQLNRLLQLELIQMTRPEVPRSRMQKYRLTEKGAQMVSESETENPN